jgi:hypothetical protein
MDSVHSGRKYKNHFDLRLSKRMHEDMRISSILTSRLASNLVEAARRLEGYGVTSLTCECCGRYIYLPEYTPEYLSRAWVTIVRARTGRLLYYCSRGCRRCHRGQFSEVGIIFKPEDALV